MTRARRLRTPTFSRFVNWLEQLRGAATQYEERAANYQAMVVIAGFVIWLTS